MQFFSAPKTQQDRWVVETLQKMRNGYFLDIGAADGVNASNTYVLEKYLNWMGICVEPNTVWFRQCYRNRKAICVNKCIYSSQGKVIFVEPARNLGFGGIRDNLKEHKRAMWDDGGKVVTKSAITLHQLLQDNNAPKIIDYVSLDVEGSEFEILKEFPFEEYQFRTVTVEGPSCNDLLKSKGYSQVHSPYCQVTWENFFVKDNLIG